MLLFCVRSQLQKLEEAPSNLQARSFRLVIVCKNYDVWSFVSFGRFINLIRFGIHVQFQPQPSHFDQLARKEILKSAADCQRAN